jgi:hypothetical protein
MHQNGIKEMFFEEQERVIGFFFNQLVDGVVRIESKGRASIGKTASALMKVT